MKVTIYHKTTCSKSCEAISFLKEKKADYNVIEYLDTPPTKKELRELLRKLGMKAEELVRKKESLFTEKYADRNFSEEEWIEILVNNPVLIERPIIVVGDKAIIARPASLIDSLLK